MSGYREHIESIVDDIGCPKHIKGYEAIIEAVEYQLLNRGANIMDTYSEVASKLDKTSAQIERNIRHAIESTLMTCDYNNLKKYFGNNLPDTYHLTNKQFLVTVAIAVKRLKRKQEETNNVNNGR